MAKFCTKCGKELIEGKTCDCEKAISTEKTSTQSGFDFNECLNSYIDIIKGIFKCPIDTIKKYATSSNFLLGIIALALNSIVSGIFLYCLCKEALGSLGSIMGTLSGGYGSLMAGNIDIPFMRIFLLGIGFMIAGFIVTALMIYLIAGVILKENIDIKKSIALVGTCSVFTTITTAVAIILTYMSIKFMMIVLLLAGIFYLTYLAQGISNTTKIDKNKLAYVFVPSIAVATFVVVYILPKILF